MSTHSKNVGVRGSSWREKEILDLLSCWGEEKIQEALKSSHRNFDCFVRVAEQMALRGHKRSALECRSKTKTMRLEYKKVVAHNSRSGNAPITCPYFRELDSILRGDASVRPKRLSRSMVLQVVSENRGNALELQEGSEELFSHEMITMEQGLLRSSTPCSEVVNHEHPPMTAQISDPDVTIDGLDGSGRSLSPAGCDGDQADKENAAPDARDGSNMRSAAELSPGTRLANIRNRRRRTAGLYSVAESMMAQSSEEHKAELEERRKEQQEARLWHSEFMQDNRQERLVLQETFTQHLELLRCAVTALNNMGEAVLHQRDTPRAVSAAPEPHVISTHQDRAGHPKRSCVGKARDRLTM